jgi:nickel superoxide dismutase
VYDPEQARIEAESCFRIMEKYQASADDTFRARAIGIKEERAELVKHHLDVLWHDYFKPEHLATVPNLHELFWTANKQVSKVKASVDPADGQKLLDLINDVDAAWKATGGPGKTRVAGRPG